MSLSREEQLALLKQALYYHWWNMEEEARYCLYLLAKSLED